MTAMATARDSSAARRKAAIGLLAAMLGLAGCAAGTPPAPNAAFALSASALSGKDSYAFSGQLSVYDPAGKLADQSSFDGEIDGHRLAALSSAAAWSRPLAIIAYLEARGTDVKYVKVDSDEVELELRLDGEAAKRRMAEELRARMNAVEQETLDTLSVATVCRWTADRRTWFPKKLREQTELSYSQDGRRYSEKRISETIFQPKA
ncbi:hypothetical protein [Cohnella fermenti]|uniref:Lipoprotein n=1 Tax=Cohnella fermenti TaxID=2565925 RepID=A0A4S4BI12_9BACL|nr:hypothetical protein [Cohnella fermenti]THF74229.1 hypothetical protein E6C55_26020 [Cohnella fermenti]